MHSSTDGTAEESKLAQQIAVEGPRYLRAFADGDPENTAVWFGEAAGLIDTIEPAATIIERMVADAANATANVDLVAFRRRPEVRRRRAGIRRRRGRVRPANASSNVTPALVTR